LKNPNDPNDISFSKKQDFDSSMILNDSLLEEEKQTIEVGPINSPD
jgi:hypothetical protein